MARDAVQLPPDSTGKAQFAATFTEAGTPAPNAGLRYVPGVLVSDDLGVIARVNSTLAAVQVAGSTYAAATGTITTATSTVTSADIGAAGNATITVNGTYAGVRLVFEVSDDAGTTWYAVGASREDNGQTESDTGVLVANTSRMWTTAAPGFNRLRVRATAWTSGTANVRISAGTYPFEPMVSAVPSKGSSSRLTLVTAATGLTAGTSGTHALAALANAYRDTTLLGGGTGTSFALTAGKTFRVQGMSIGIRAAAASATSLVANLLYNSGGAVTTSSQVIAQLQCGAWGAAIGAAGQAVLSFGDGIDIPAGVTPGQVGVSIIPTWTTTAAIVTLSVVGYEL